jgi:transcriptional regulator with XRE-family HTH domain
MRRTFASLLRTHIEAAGITRAEFARRSGSAHGSLYSLLSGKFRPPDREEKLRAWAGILGLKPREADRFVLAALIDRAPPTLRKEIDRLQRVEARWKRR